MEKSYRLINKETNEATICEKVVIGDFEYYVIEEEILKDDECYFITENNGIFHKGKKDTIIDHPNRKKPHRKVVATNFPGMSPNIFYEVSDQFSLYFTDLNSKNIYEDNYRNKNKSFRDYMSGYNKSKETYSFSEEDMLEFGKFCHNDAHSTNRIRTFKELLEKYKEQKIETIYYGIQ